MLSPGGVAYWAYTGFSGLYYGWNLHKYRKRERKERQELDEELIDLEMHITDAQNRIYESYNWEAKWKGLETARKCLYSLKNEMEKAPYRGTSLKELAFEYRGRVEGFENLKKGFPPLREALRNFGEKTRTTEAGAVSAYIRYLESGIRDKYGSVEECLQLFEKKHSFTDLASSSKTNRAKRFTDEHGQISADPGVIAYVSASAAKVYKNPPDWVPFPKGKYFGQLKPKKPKSRKGKTRVRCGRFGVDRIVFEWDYDDVPNPVEIAARAEKSARWGWFKVACIVANEFDQEFKDFVKNFASPGLVLYTHDLNNGETMYDRNAASPAFLGYFEPNRKPQNFREYLRARDAKSNGLDAAYFRSIGFEEKGVSKLEARDLLYEAGMEEWRVNPV